MEELARQYHSLMVALRKLFNRRTIPGLVLVGLSYAWGAFGIWARLEFITSRIQQAWPFFVGNAGSVTATRLTFENMLLFTGVIWIGVGMWRRPSPMPQPPVALTGQAAQEADNWQYKEMEGRVWRYKVDATRGMSEFLPSHIPVHYVWVRSVKFDFLHCTHRHDVASRKPTSVRQNVLWSPKRFVPIRCPH